MLEVFDRNMIKKAILQNAYNITEESPLNGVGQLSFSLPADDPKCAYCAAFGYVRSEQGVIYRILSPSAKDSAASAVNTYTAEHAIATLVDDIMFKAHVIGGIGISTADVINYILGFQTIKHWQLGQCDFALNYEYGFESENLYNALMSVANLFVDKYAWTYDFSTTPWTVNLKKLDAAHPQFYIRAGKNLLGKDSDADCGDVCTRLYLLGYGEGDNQLTIKDVNNGLPYLQAEQKYIDAYGLISKVYVDRSFEDAESLKARGEALLAAMKEPTWSRSYSAADLYEITGQRYDTARAGDLVKLCDDDTTAYVTKVTWNRDTPGDMKLELSTKATDIAASIADLADRQRIEQVYSQGATQIYAQSIQANADSTTPCNLSFYIPDRMTIINKVEAKIKIESFRSYNRVTSGGGASTNTSSAGGASTNTSSAGGAAVLTTEEKAFAQNVVITGPIASNGEDISVTGENQPSNGGRATEAASGSTGSSGTLSVTTNGTNTSPASASHTHTVGRHSHSIAANAAYTGYTQPTCSQSDSTSHYHAVPGMGGTAASHTHSLGGHTHSILGHTHPFWHKHGASISFTIPGLSLKIPAHTHTVSAPAHTHSVSIPSHTHNIEQGIFRFGAPSGAKVLINGAEKADMETSATLDLTEYMLNDSGKIPRNSWITLGVKPNDLAYITIDIFVQGFIQSRGGGSY